MCDLPAAPQAAAQGDGDGDGDGYGDPDSESEVAEERNGMPVDVNVAVARAVDVTREISRDLRGTDGGEDVDVADDDNGLVRERGRGAAASLGTGGGGEVDSGTPRGVARERWCVVELTALVASTLLRCFRFANQLILPAPTRTQAQAQVRLNHRCFFRRRRRRRSPQAEPHRALSYSRDQPEFETPIMAHRRLGSRWAEELLQRDLAIDRLVKI